MKKSLYFAVPVALAVIFFGCGGSTQTDNDTDNDALSTAKFSAQTTGVSYICGSQEGTLNTNEEFTFEEGKDCTFYDGDTVIHTIAAADLKEGETFSEPTAVDLETLLLDKTYYAVQPGDNRVLTLRFYEEDGSYKVDASGSTQTIPSIDITINGNRLTIPMLQLVVGYTDYAEMTFIEDKGDYLLFSGDVYLYTDKAKADALAAGGASSSSSSSAASSSSSSVASSSSSSVASSSSSSAAAVDLATLLLGKTYYAVQPHNTRVLPLKFYEEGGSYKVDASGSTQTVTSGITINGNVLSIAILQFLEGYEDYAQMTLIEDTGDYLLFSGENYMYIDKAKAEAFVAANP